MLIIYNLRALSRFIKSIPRLRFRCFNHLFIASISAVELGRKISRFLRIYQIHLFPSVVFFLVQLVARDSRIT